MNPRANLIALIQASVPELTNLIFSISGTIDKDNLARSVSKVVGIPKEVPFLAVFDIALITLGCA